MKCYGLVRRTYGASKEEIYPPPKSGLRLFASMFQSKINELMEFCMDLDSGYHYMEVQSGYYLNAFVLNGEICAALTDTKLSDSQLRQLYVNMARYQIPLQEVFEHFEHYLIDIKVTRVLEQSEQTRQLMIEAVDKLVDRGEKIEDLVNACEALSESGQVFKHNAKELNRCCGPMTIWPSVWSWLF